MSNPEKVIKIREIRSERWGRLWWKWFMEKVSFESGVEPRWVMHSESGDDDDDDDDELMWVRWDDSDRNSSSTGWRSSLWSSFQGQGEAWWERVVVDFHRGTFFNLIFVCTCVCVTDVCPAHVRFHGVDYAGVCCAVNVRWSQRHSLYHRTVNISFSTLDVVRRGAEPEN